MELPLFPLNTVLFPGGTLPLHIFEERYKRMIGRCIEEGQPFGVVLIRNGPEVGGIAEPFEIGTTAHIQEVEQLDDGKLNIVCAGGRRFRVRDTSGDSAYLLGDVEIIEPQRDYDAETLDLASETGALFAEYVRLYLAITNQWARALELPRDPETLADFIASRLPIEAEDKQKLLEELSPKLRLQIEKDVLGDAIREMTVQVEGARALRWYGFGVMN